MKWIISKKIFAIIIVLEINEILTIMVMANPKRVKYKEQENFLG